jgi:hypothetical protein
MDKILFDSNLNIKFDEFLFFLENHHDPKMLELYEGIRYIKFLWQGRIVNTILQQWT